jgi:NAD(P)-dependent dehydrogenase (short-subunit alcohol dehydrogenase family)
MEHKSKTWFITGCATGFGRALAELALARGDRVAATDRHRDAVADLARNYAESALALGLDVTKPDEIRAGLNAAFARFGRIDVLVNNAGYGVLAAVEEASDAQIRHMFEVNFFGMLEVIRAALPRLREQRSGHIVNFSSMGGRVSAPLVALYGASKFAVEGLSEGLAQELAPLGIKVTAVEPGAFATRFSASAVTPEKTLDDYGPVREAMQATIGSLRMGNPADLAAAVMKVVDSPEPPLRFIGGADAYAMIENSLAAQTDEMKRWRELSASANKAALQAG